MNKNVANRSVMHSILLDYKTNKPIEYIDYANVVTTRNGRRNRLCLWRRPTCKRVASVANQVAL